MLVVQVLVNLPCGREPVLSRSPSQQDTILTPRHQTVVRVKERRGRFGYELLAGTELGARARKIYTAGCLPTATLHAVISCAAFLTLALARLCCKLMSA